MSFIKLFTSTFLAVAVSQIALAASNTSGVKLPPYKKAVLKNGMTVVMMEQHKVPLIDIRLTFKTGSASDPENKEGLASLTANLLQKGTKKYSALQIAESLDSVGAQFSASAGLESTTSSAQFMSKDISKGLELFAEILMQPTFPETEFAKLQAQIIDEVRSSRDRPQAVLGKYFNVFFYGSHPYAKMACENTLAAITREDVKNCYDTNYSPNNAILVVVGAFKTSEMEKMISQHFSGWKASIKAKSVDLPEPEAVKGKKLLLVDKPDATQTYFMVGNLGVDRTNPDRDTIRVVNTLFGERFTSMINSALRIKSGLTYGAGASFRMSKTAGPFVISSFTANATTEKAIELTLETLKELHDDGLSAEDIESAKIYIKGTYPTRNLETSGQLASVLSDLQFYGLPDSDVNGYYARIDAVAVEDARRIIKKYYPLDDLCFVLVGKAEEIRSVAEKFSKNITEKSISAPGF